MLIAVLNASAKVTNTEASTMTRAVAWQANHHIGPAWRLDAPPVIFYRHVEDVPPGALHCLIADTPVADALGYHSQDPEGKPYLRVFVDPVEAAGGTVLGAQVDTPPDVTLVGTWLSVSTVLSHEVAEVMGDPECNRWAQRPDGRLICLELGDPVQASSYTVLVVTGRRRQRIAVSNFVYPAWFDDHAEAGARFDQLGHVGAPFTLERGGYQIWTDGRTYGNEFARSVDADELESRAADKLHPAARTRRRYEALEAMGAVADTVAYVQAPRPMPAE